MSKLSIKELHDRFQKVKCGDEFTSQTAFEDNHPTLPEGFVGFFAYHFQISCQQDISDLQDLIETMDFSKGCGKSTGRTDWDLVKKTAFLVSEIEHWDSRKYWPTGSILALAAAAATAIGSYVSSSLDIAIIGQTISVLVLLLFIFVLIIFIFEITRVLAQRKVWRLREALLLLSPECIESQKSDKSAEL